jgi:virulence-associated protein VagC
MSTVTKAVKEAEKALPVEEQEPDFEYVTIPERDMFDLPHPGIGNNREHFGPGTHKLPKDVAFDVKERLRIFEAQNIRILQPRKDARALHDLAKEKGLGYVDMTRDNSKQV